MSQQFLGEIRMFSFGFAPKGWAFCNGQLMSIQQNQALFAVLGTTFGGNGVTNFALPNLQSRVPMHFGSAFNNVQYSLGQTGGEESHTLLLSEMPPHSHFLRASNDVADSNTPATTILAQSQNFNLYATTTTAGTTTIDPSALDPAGNGIPHSNLQPYLAVNFCICLNGIFPSRN